MIDKLEYGKVYDTRLFDGERKALYIGKLISGRKKHKHVILTRPYWGEIGRVMCYRFNDFSIKGLELSLMNFVQQWLSEREEKYADWLMRKREL